MLKNFGKFRQWTGERLGAAKVTLQTEDFQQLETETENKRLGFEKVHEASQQVYDQLSKKKPSPEDAKVKCAPWENLSNCWMNHGATHNEDSALGVALINLGQTEARIALLQEDFVNIIKSNYIGVLDQGLQHYKEYYVLKKKLESRRLDYDAKLSRLNKSKKEKPEWEQEMQMAKMKYEECELLIYQKVTILQDYEIDHCNALSHLMEAQLSYHQQSANLINELRGYMPTPEVYRSTRPPIPPITRSSTNGSSSSKTSTHDRRTDDSFGSLFSSPITTLKSSQPSIDNFERFRRAQGYSLGSSFTGDVDQRRQPGSFNPPLPPPIIPRRTSSPRSRRLRKAIYDFKAQSPDELTFDFGDTINVIEHVDKSWWMGEIDQAGTKRRGIFPVEYTEDITVAEHMAPSPSPMPNRTRSITSDDTYTNQHKKGERKYEQEKNGRYIEVSPFHDNNLPIDTPASASRSRPPPELPPTPSSTPLPKPSAFAHSAHRPPPPPPPSRITPATSPATGTDSIMDCQDCGCDDFSVNLFKKDQCNNCFHRHVVH